MTSPTADPATPPTPDPGTTATPPDSPGPGSQAPPEDQASLDNANLNEDWLRTMSWDVRYPNGTLVEDLDGLALVLDLTREQAADMVLDEPMGKAAPATVVQEAKDVRAGKKPGGEPGGDVLLEGGDRAAGDVETTAKPDTASPIPGAPIPGQSVEEPVEPIRPQLVKGLAALVADHRTEVKALGVDPGPEPDPVAVQTVYDRGMAAWPGGDVTALSAKGWAAGRVRAYLDTAAGQRPAGYHVDDDLLPTATSVKTADPESLAARVAALLDGIDDVDDLDGEG